MAVDSAANQSRLSYFASFLKEAVDETVIPASVGFFAAGPAAAASSATVALGLFFTKKTTEYLIPELKGNRYLATGIELVNLGYTSIHSAHLIRSDHFCKAKGGVIRTGNLMFDAGKSALSFLLGKELSDNLDNYQFTKRTVGKAYSVIGIHILTGFVIKQSDVIFSLNQVPNPPSCK